MTAMDNTASRLQSLNGNVRLSHTNTYIGDPALWFVRAGRAPVDGTHRFARDVPCFRTHLAVLASRYFGQPLATIDAHFEHVRIGR